MQHRQKTKQDITAQLERGKILPLVLRLTFPAVIAQLITFLYNIVDRMYVAKIDGVGMDALAALGIVLPITLIIQAFANLVGLGGAPRAGIKLGEGNHPEANRIFNTAFLLLFALGLLIGAAAFCLTQGHSAIAMCTVLIGAVVNIALDPLFIFVLDMGVRGSSLATVLSQLCSCICILGFFFSRKSLFRFRVKEMRLAPARVSAIVSLGFTPFIMTLTECAIQIVFNINLNRATGGNKDYTAALTVMLSALQFISLPLNGLGNGMQPFVSYNYGKGNAARLKKGIKYVTVIAFIFAVTVWSVSLAVPELYAYLFSASGAVTDIVKQYTPFFLMGSIMFFVQMTLQNVNVALGQATSALLLAVTRKVVILIPLCFVLTHFLGFKGVYLSEGIADLVAGLITAAVIFTTFPRIFRKREAEVKRLHAEDAV